MASLLLTLCDGIRDASTIFCSTCVCLYLSSLLPLCAFSSSERSTSHTSPLFVLTILYFAKFLLHIFFLSASHTDILLDAVDLPSPSPLSPSVPMIPSLLSSSIVDVLHSNSLSISCVFFLSSITIMLSFFFPPVRPSSFFPSHSRTSSLDSASHFLRFVFP